MGEIGSSNGGSMTRRDGVKTVGKKLQEVCVLHNVMRMKFYEDVLTYLCVEADLVPRTDRFFSAVDGHTRCVPGALL